MLTTLDEGVLGGCSVDLGEYLCARVVVAKWEQYYRMAKIWGSKHAVVRCVWIHMRR